MALWAFIPGKHLDTIGSLPESARRLDTGEKVDLTGDGVKWARATGWWNLDELDTASLATTNRLTTEELADLLAEIDAALVDRERRRNFLAKARNQWAAAKGIGQDRLDLAGGYERPVRPAQGAPVATWIAYLEDNDAYLLDWVRFIQRTITGGGTFDTPGIGDLLLVMAQVVAGLVDQSVDVELPEDA